MFENKIGIIDGLGGFGLHRFCTLMCCNRKLVWKKVGRGRK